MWENAEDLIAAIEGNQGPDLQQEALDFAEQIGLLDQWTAEAEAQQAGGYDNALEAEFQRLENAVGKLTPDIEQHIIDSISTQNRGEGVIPDLVATYAEQIASTRNTEEGRIHFGEAAAERAFAQQAEEQSRRQLSYEQPVGGDEAEHGPEDE